MRAIITLFILFLSHAVSYNAFAGAWLMEKGKHQIIGQYGHSDFKYLDYNIKKLNGLKGDIQGNGDVYKIQYEYGLSDNFTLGLKQYVTSEEVVASGGEVAYAGIGDQISSVRDYYYTDLYSRYKLYQKENYVFSIQPLVRRIAGGETEIEARGLFGIGFPVIQNHISYFDAEFAAERNLDTNHNAYHMDFKFGLRANEDWMLLTQTYSYLYHEYGYNKFVTINALDLSILRKIDNNTILQTGTLFNVSKRNKVRRNEYYVGVWFDF